MKSLQLLRCAEEKNTVAPRAPNQAVNGPLTRVPCLVLEGETLVSKEASFQVGKHLVNDANVLFSKTNFFVGIQGTIILIVFDLQGMSMVFFSIAMLVYRSARRSFQEIRNLRSNRKPVSHRLPEKSYGNGCPEVEALWRIFVVSYTKWIKIGPESHQNHQLFQ